MKCKWKHSRKKTKFSRFDEENCNRQKQERVKKLILFPSVHSSAHWKMRVRGYLDLLRRTDANNSTRNLPHKRFGKPRNKFYTHKCLAIYIMQTLCTTAGLCSELSIRAFPIRLHTILVWQTCHINALVSTTLQIFNNLNCAWGWKVRVREECVKLALVTFAYDRQCVKLSMRRRLTVAMMDEVQNVIRVLRIFPFSLFSFLWLAE